MWLHSDIANPCISETMEAMFIGSGASNHSVNSINLPIGNKRKITMKIGGTLTSLLLVAYGYKRMGINA